MNKRPQSSSVDKAVVNVWQREVGQLSPRGFAHRLGGSEDLVLRLDLHRKLARHTGCVNTVSFNTEGDILVSGSDDMQVILWNWETGKIQLSFHSGHTNNVFQAKIMPYTDDRSIVTCAADGRVRHAQISEQGQVKTSFLGKHLRRAHKLAIEPGSPHVFYSCGEDGMVQHFDLRNRVATKLFTCQPLDSRRDVNHLNAIAIDPRNPNYFAVAGSDEYTRLFDIRKYRWDGSSDFGQPVNLFCPPHIIGDEDVGITGLAFSEQSELLVSYYNEYIYLFTRDMGLGPNPIPTSPVSMGSDPSEMSGDQQCEASPSTMDMDESYVPPSAPQVYKGHRNIKTVKGVNFFGPNCEYVVSGSDCGRIFIWKKKGGELIRVMEADKRVVNCIESHPHTTVLASSGIDHDIKIWTPKANEKASLPPNIERVQILGRIMWYASGDEDEDEDEDEDDDDNEDEEEDDDECFSDDTFDDNDDYEDNEDDEGEDDDSDDGDDYVDYEEETEGSELDVPLILTRGVDDATIFAAKVEDKPGAQRGELICRSGPSRVNTNI